ncbi:MAG: hypothetical protein EOP62_09340 [Sphingomonadales bacterium]|nr:MAG: hypothetical protein EOP62_09340 [Sphingomonadales bacterium]
MRLPYLVAAFALTMVSTAMPAAAQKCDESCLLDIAGDYLDGLAANDISTVPFAPGVKATENGVVSAPGEGIWKTAQMWLYRHTNVDPVTGEIVVLGSVSEGDGPDKKPLDALTVVRLKVASRKIVESELLVVRPGEFALFGPRTFTDPHPLFGAQVPVAKRSTRKELAAIGRGYFDALIQGNPKRVAFHPDCNRWENGIQTTNNPVRRSSSCAEGMRRFPYMHSYRDVRIPIIDQERGLVLAITAFDMPLQTRTIQLRKNKSFEVTPERNRLPRTLFLYELFKIEGGRIRYIEAMMRNMPLGADLGWGGDKGNANHIE